MPKFNIDQQKALDTTLNENVVISAGAGSGKTNTLSEKVLRLLSDTSLDTSELLVLTFTNNSAHDMKKKIIAKCASNPLLKDKILSSHIQTFDSFSEYLVNKYAYLLGLSDNVNVADQDILNTKLLSSIDEILNEYYASPTKYKAILRTLRKISLFDDKPLKAIIYHLYHELDKYLEKDREQYMKNASSIFLSREHFNKVIDQYVTYYKNRIKDVIYEAYFQNEYYDKLNLDIVDTGEIYQTFASKNYNAFLDLDTTSLTFHHDEMDNILSIYNHLLSLPSEEFIKEVQIIFKEKVDQNILFVGGNKVKGDKKTKNTLKLLMRCFATKEAVLLPLRNIGTLITSDNDSYTFSLDLDYLKIISFKEDINLIFDIIKELDKRLLEYQISTNTYTFQTISRLALSLLNNKEVASEVRETYKYIMIDEYQDTNDIQEAFLDILLEPRRSDGQSATLFVVGDVKQSIYAFRNSNVELFKKRMDDTKTKKTIISMNKNYRSGEVLLNDINYIFSSYMKLSHGGVDYDLKGEALSYDKDVNLYSEPYSNFGVKRITSTSRMGYDGLTTIKEKQMWEALAIIDDIKRKMSDPNYTVSVRTPSGNKIRHVELNDFAIIVRKKKGALDLYSELFANAGIKLNVIYDEALFEADAIIVIQSLISMIAYIQGKAPDVDVRHLYMSLARSYIYQYDDEKIFHVLTSDGEINKDDLSKLKEDDLYKDIEDFAIKHMNDSLSIIYLDMIDHFKILEKLYLIGNIKDNIAKIESYYHLILSEENSRQGLKEFIELMNNISKYDLSLVSNNKVEVKDGVDLMTIHASKGLEKKIVYLPNSFNKFMKGQSDPTLNYTFSKENGLIFPYYSYDMHKNIKDEYELGTTLSTTFYEYVEDLKDRQTDIDEHVRLFYVALTRAENTVYIVGDASKRSSDKNEENLYGMLSYIPSYPVFNPKIDFSKNRYFDHNLLEKIEILKKLILSSKLPLEASSFTSKEAYERYKSYYQNDYHEKLYEKVDNLLNEIENQCFAYYYSSILNLLDDIDVLARIYASYYYRIRINSFSSFVYYLETHIFKEDDDEDVHHPYKYINKEGLRDYLLNEFADAVKEGNLDALEIKKPNNRITYLSSLKKVYDPDIAFNLEDDFLLIFASIIDDIDYIYYWSYQNEDYQDEVSSFDYLSYLKTSNITKPDIKDVLIDETKIVFNERFKEKASKKIVEQDDDLSLIFERGTYLHRLLEMVDFKSKDTSFLTNPSDRALIDAVLKLPLFDEVNHASKVYKEYGYYDEKRGSNGFIDLFYITKNADKDIYTIVDYKTRHTHDDGYVKQLNIYKENIIRLFNLDINKVEFRLYLLSIEDKKLFEVK